MTVKNINISNSNLISIINSLLNEDVKKVVINFCSKNSYINQEGDIVNLYIKGNKSMSIDDIEKFIKGKIHSLNVKNVDIKTNRIDFELLKNCHSPPLEGEF